MSEDIVMTEDASMATPSMLSNPTFHVSLNFDTLVAVMPWIQTRRDLFSFMATCSGLYNAGIPTLLGFHFMITPRTLSKFYHFLISKSPISFLSLRGLYFSFASRSTQTRLGLQETGWLTEILSRAKNLHYIEIFGDLLHQAPALYKTLAQLSSLQTLDLLSTHGNDPEQYTLITQLQSPLSTLRFEGVGQNLDVVNALANFRGTLCELTISEFTLYHLPPGPVYSNVVFLSLTGIVNSLLSILIPAFPNVKTLHVDLLILHEGNPAIRENNLQYQADHPTQCWQLSSLVADVPSLWTLSLRSGVPEVEVHDFSLERDLEYLEPSLVHLRPLQLTFENDQDPTLGDSWLSKTITDGWKELARLDFEYTFPTVPNQWNQHLDKLYKQLALVSSSKPDLCILSIRLSPNYQDVQSTDYSATCDYLADLDMHTVASRIAKAVPGLALLELKNVAEKSHWFRQQDGLAPFSPSLSQPDFECLSEGLLAPLRNAYRSNLATTDDDNQTQ